jgi:hypothetical protein
MYLLLELEFAFYEDNPERPRFTAAGFCHRYGEEWRVEVKRLYAWLSFEYPELITAYTTHDLQYALIKDVNKLAKVLYGEKQ